MEGTHGNGSQPYNRDEAFSLHRDRELPVPGSTDKVQEKPFTKPPQSERTAQVAGKAISLNNETSKSQAAVKSESFGSAFERWSGTTLSDQARRALLRNEPPPQKTTKERIIEAARNKYSSLKKFTSKGLEKTQDAGRKAGAALSVGSSKAGQKIKEGYKALAKEIKSVSAKAQDRFGNKDLTLSEIEAEFKKPLERQAEAQKKREEDLLKMRDQLKSIREPGLQKSSESLQNSADQTERLLSEGDQEKLEAELLKMRDELKNIREPGLHAPQPSKFGPRTASTSGPPSLPPKPNQKVLDDSGLSNGLSRKNITPRTPPPRPPRPNEETLRAQLGNSDGPPVALTEEQNSTVKPDKVKEKLKENEVPEENSVASTNEGVAGQTQIEHTYSASSPKSEEEQKTKKSWQQSLTFFVKHPTSIGHFFKTRSVEVASPMPSRENWHEDLLNKKASLFEEFDKLGALSKEIRDGHKKGRIILKNGKFVIKNNPSPAKIADTNKKIAEILNDATDVAKRLDEPIGAWNLPNRLTFSTFLDRLKAAGQIEEGTEFDQLFFDRKIIESHITNAMVPVQRLISKFDEARLTFLELHNNIPETLRASKIKLRDGSTKALSFSDVIGHEKKQGRIYQDGESYIGRFEKAGLNPESTVKQFVENTLIPQTQQQIESLKKYIDQSTEDNEKNEFLNEINRLSEDLKKYSAYIKSEEFIIDDDIARKFFSTLPLSELIVNFLNDGVLNDFNKYCDYHYPIAEDAIEGGLSETDRKNFEEKKKAIADLVKQLATSSSAGYDNIALLNSELTLFMEDFPPKNL